MQSDLNIVLICSPLRNQTQEFPHNIQCPLGAPRPPPAAPVDELQLIITVQKPRPILTQSTSCSSPAAATPRIPSYPLDLLKPFDRLLQSRIHIIIRMVAQGLPCSRDVCQRVPDVPRSWLVVFRLDLNAYDLNYETSQLAQADPPSAGDVEYPNNRFLFHFLPRSPWPPPAH